MDLDEVVGGAPEGNRVNRRFVMRTVKILAPDVESAREKGSGRGGLRHGPLLDEEQLILLFGGESGDREQRAAHREIYEDCLDGPVLNVKLENNIRRFSAPSMPLSGRNVWRRCRRRRKPSGCRPARNGASPAFRAGGCRTERP